MEGSRGDEDIAEKEKERETEAERESEGREKQRQGDRHTVLDCSPNCRKAEFLVYKSWLERACNILQLVIALTTTSRANRLKIL